MPSYDHRQHLSSCRVMQSLFGGTKRARLASVRSRQTHWRRQTSTNKKLQMKIKELRRIYKCLLNEWVVLFFSSGRAALKPSNGIVNQGESSKGDRTRRERLFPGAPSPVQGLIWKALLFVPLNFPVWREGIRAQFSKEESKRSGQPMRRFCAVLCALRCD